GIHRIEWPPNSHDRKTIEHVWWFLKKHVLKSYPELLRMGNSRKEFRAFLRAYREA
ncbi:hypothetical protein BDY21DRAFT_285266, partial [Lineolata rhizophorae]